MSESNNDELKAAADEVERIKKLVLQILHQQGIIAFDASGRTLGPELEERIVGSDD